MHDTKPDGSFYYLVSNNYRIPDGSLDKTGG